MSGKKHGSSELFNRTLVAIDRQLSAFACPQYDLIVRQWTGLQPNDFFIRDRRRLKATDFLVILGPLRGMNVEGCDIWVVPRPGPNTPHLALIDDLNQEAVAAMRADKIVPVVVTETSPDNFQAWVRIPTALSPIVASRALCRRYGGDIGGIGSGSQPGRLAGFTNRKPCHRKSNGRYPWVLLRSAKSQAPPLNPIGPIAPYLLTAISDGFQDQNTNHAPALAGLGSAQERPAAPAGHKYGGRDTSASGADWSMTCRMISTGRSDQEILSAIQRSAEQRCKRQPARYAERTLARAKSHMKKDFRA